MSTSSPQAHGLILFAHGSRDPAWAQPFLRLKQKIARDLPAVAVELAFLEQMQPSLAQAIGDLAARGVERITLLPLFMAQGSHLREQLPQLVAAACTRNPGVLVRPSAPIGDVDALLEAIAAWAVQEHERTRAADLGHPSA